MNPLPQKKSRAAFTLVELLVAMGIVSLIMVMVLQIFNGATRTWQAAEQSTEAFRDARAALLILTSDIKNTLSVTNTLPPAVSCLTTEPLYNVRGSSAENDEIYALAFLRNDSLKSDICAVGYYTFWDARFGAYVLKRYFKNADETFDRLRDDRTPFEPSGSDSQYDETLATYVWDFRITAYDYEGKALPRERAYKNELPAYIQIDFKALPARAVQKLKAQRITREDWQDNDSKIYRTSIEPYAQNFSTRVSLASSAADNMITK